MRLKTCKTVVTFASTSDAMNMESLARDNAIPGRIIPVPSDISAGCGLAWCADEPDKDTLLTALETYAIPHEGAFQIMLY